MSIQLFLLHEIVQFSFHRTADPATCKINRFSACIYFKIIKLGGGENKIGFCKKQKREGCGSGNREGLLLKLFSCLLLCFLLLISPQPNITPKKGVIFPGM